MEKGEFGVVVIGSGPGGYVAAIRAAMLGFHVACVEKMPTLGGTCLNIGCIPSKALLQSTEHYEWIKKSAREHGIQADPTIDFGAMMKRKEAVVNTLTGSIPPLFKRYQVEKIAGKARFVDPHRLEIENGSEKRIVTADHLIIATGSEPIPLPFLPFDEERIVSSTGALSLKAIPKKLLVIGAGVIGVELASVYRRLGSEVRIIEMLDRITPPLDSGMSKHLLQILKKQGLEFYLGAKVIKGGKKGEGVQLTVEHENQTLSLEGDLLLVGVGRRPYTEGLGLEAAGIALSPKGFIPVDGNFKTSQEHIYAIGDAIEGPMLAHRATHEGIAAAEVIAGRPAHVNYIAIPNVIYTSPEMASVGLSEEEAQGAHLEVLIGTSFFRANSRARCNGEIEGLVKVIGEKKSGRLIGMHILGAQASELIAEGMIAMEKKARLEEIANACHAHPTLSEALMDACQNVRNGQ